MAHRRITVKRSLAAVALLPLMAACSATQSPQSSPGDATSSLTQDETAAPSPQGNPGDATSSLSQDEIAKAETVARGVIADQGATVTSASVIARPGTVEDSNTGHPCTSGRLLQVKLIGDFPNIDTTGHPADPGSPPPDFTVRAMIVTADAESGRACLLGVQTAENGEPTPTPGSTILSLG